MNESEGKDIAGRESQTTAPTLSHNSKAARTELNLKPTRCWNLRSKGWSAVGGGGSHNLSRCLLV